MKNIYLYTDSKGRCTNTRLQTPAKVGDICKIYVDGQHMYTAQACMHHGPESTCRQCCMFVLRGPSLKTCMIPVEYIKAADTYLGRVCCGDSNCYFKDMTEVLEEL